MKELEIGDEVVRGPDWYWDDQDGGEGNIGVVVDLDAYRTPGWHTVKWPDEHINNYQYEYGNCNIKLAPTITAEEIKIEPVIEKKSPPVKRMKAGEFKDVLKGL